MRRSASWAATLLIAVALLYALTIGLEPGQRVDDLAFEGRKATQLPVRRAVTALMRIATPVVLTAAAVALVVLPVRRRQWRTAVVTLGSAAGAVGLARLLKTSLPREQLLDFSWASQANSYPSGHSAAIMAVALGLVTVAPGRRRGRVAAAAAVVVVSHTVAMLGSGWHRPSDVLGALLLAASVMALAAAAVRTDLRSNVPSEVGPTWFDRDRVPVWLLVAVTVVPLIGILAVRNNPPNPAHPLGAFGSIVVLSSVVAVLLVWCHRRLVDALVDPGRGER